MARTMLWMLAALFAMTAGQAAQAQPAPNYPNKPIRYVVAFPPSGMTGLISRIIAQKIAES